MDSELKSAIDNIDENKIKEKSSASDDDFEDAFNYAIRNNNVKAVDILLNQKIISPSLFSYALSVVVDNGYAEILKLLLKDKRTQEHKTAFEYAFTRDVKILNHPEIVSILLDDKRANPYQGTGRFVKWAIEQGKTEILALLIKDGRYITSYVRDAILNGANKCENKEIVKLLMEDKRINPAANPEQFFQEAFDKIPKIIFSRENPNLEKEESNSEKSSTISLESDNVFYNNDSYIEDQNYRNATHCEPLFLDEQKKRVPIGYNIHLPPSGIEVKNVIVHVYGGHQHKDGKDNVSQPKKIGDLDMSLLEKGTAVITLNLPDLLELDVFQSMMTEEFNNKLQACIHKVYHTIQFNPERLHEELAILKNKQIFLYGASFGGLNTILHAEQYPGTFDGYISHNGGVNPAIDRMNRPYNPDINPTNKRKMNNISSPILLMTTQADNNVFVKESLSFYNQLNDEQKDKFARLWITNKGNTLPLEEKDKSNKGHFLPTNKNEFDSYLETINQFMEKGPSALPQVSRWRGHKEEILSDKYKNKASIDEKFVAEAFKVCKHKGHRTQEDIFKAWKEDFVPVFNAIWYAKANSDNVYKYQNKINNDILTDEVLINFLKFQTGILKEFFEDNYFTLPENFDLLKSLEKTEKLNALRELLSQPTRPYDQQKQEYLLTALYQATPSLLEHESPSNTYHEQLDSAKSKLIEARAKERSLIRSVFKETVQRALKEKGVLVPSLLKQNTEDKQTHSRNLLDKALKEVMLNSQDYLMELFKDKDSFSVNIYDERAETVFYGEGGLLTLSGYNYIRKLQLDAAMSPSGPLKNVYLSPKDHPKLNVPVFIGENSEPICVYEKQSVDSGNFGQVYLGVRVDTGQPCLVKKQAVNEAESKALIAFDRQIENYIQEGNVQYEAQKIFAGQSLKHIIQTDKGSRIELPENNRLNMSKDIAKAISGFHKKGWFHRDLSLDNILSTQKTGEINIIDLGFAVQADTKLQYNDSNSVGNLLYRPPELLDLSATEFVYNEQTEVYSLGIVLAILNSNQSLDDVTNNISRNGIYLIMDPYNAASTSQQIPQAIKDVLPEIFKNEPASTPAQTLLNKLIQEMTDKDPSNRPKIDDVYKMLNTIQLAQSFLNEKDPQVQKIIQDITDTDSNNRPKISDVCNTLNELVQAKTLATQQATKSVTQTPSASIAPAPEPVDGRNNPLLMNSVPYQRNRSSSLSSTVELHAQEKPKEPLFLPSNPLARSNSSPSLSLQQKKDETPAVERKASLPKI